MMDYRLLHSRTYPQICRQSLLPPHQWPQIVSQHRQRAQIGSHQALVQLWKRGVKICGREQLLKLTSIVLDDLSKGTFLNKPHTRNNVKIFNTPQIGCQLTFSLRKSTPTECGYFKAAGGAVSIITFNHRKQHFLMKGQQNSWQESQVTFSS